MSRLLPLILARRSFPRPRAPFAVRELSAEEHARLAAMSARGQWDRAHAEGWQAREEGANIGAVWRAREAQYDREQRELVMARRGTFMPDAATWGAR